LGSPFGPLPLPSPSLPLGPAFPPSPPLLFPSSPHVGRPKPRPPSPAPCLPLRFSLTNGTRPSDISPSSRPHRAEDPAGVPPCSPPYPTRPAARTSPQWPRGPPRRAIASVVNASPSLACERAQGNGDLAIGTADRSDETRGRASSPKLNTEATR